MKRISSKMVLRVAGLAIFAALLTVADLGAVIARMDQKFFFTLLACLIPISLAYLFRALRFWAVAETLLGPQSFKRMFHAAVIESGLMQVSSLAAAPVKLLYTEGHRKSVTERLYCVMVDKVYEYILPFLIGFGAVLALWGPYPQDTTIFSWLIALLFVRPVLLKIFLAALRYLPRMPLLGRLGKAIPACSADNCTMTAAALGSKVYWYTLLTTAMFYCCFWIISFSAGLGLGFHEIIMVLSLSTFIGIIPFTFFGVGTRDLGLAGVFALLERPIEEAVFLSFGMLGIRILMVVIAGLWWLLVSPAKSDR